MIRESFVVGANVVDADGNVFVDLTSGFGVQAVGHAHPRVVEAVRRQAGRLLHGLGDLHPSDVKIALLDRLAELAPWDEARVVLSLNGADAVEKMSLEERVRRAMAAEAIEDKIMEQAGELGLREGREGGVAEEGRGAGTSTFGISGWIPPPGSYNTQGP